MHAAAAVLSTLLVAVLVLVAPVLGRRRYRRLKLHLETDPGSRLRYYHTSIIRAWAVVGVVLLIGALSGYSFHALGLPTSSRYRFDSGLAAYDLFILVIALIIGQVILVRRTSRGRFGMAAPLRGAVALLPRTTAERRAFVWVALTAGICEEIVYRGFGLAYVHWAFPSTSSTVAVVATSLAFGIAHAYQGWLGIGATTLVGLLFGIIVVATGTLLIAIVLHILIDLRILVLPQRLLEALESTGNAEQTDSSGL